jgi:hypothetical protein
MTYKQHLTAMKDGRWLSGTAKMGVTGNRKQERVGVLVVVPKGSRAGLACMVAESANLSIACL